MHDPFLLGNRSVFDNKVAPSKYVLKFAQEVILIENRGFQQKNVNTALNSLPQSVCDRGLVDINLRLQKTSKKKAEPCS